jgi:multicomponent Na+:H+ antiporter subunit F
MRFVLDLVTIGLTISLVFVIIRLVRGPSLPNRVVAADQVSIHVIAEIVIYSVRSGESILLDLVIVTAIVGFVSVAVLGVYLDRAAKGQVRLETRDLPDARQKGLR